MAKRSNKSESDRQAAVDLLTARADAAEDLGIAAQNYNHALSQADAAAQKYRDAWETARRLGWTPTDLKSLPSVTEIGLPPRAPKAPSTSNPGDLPAT